MELYRFGDLQKRNMDHVRNNDYGKVSDGYHTIDELYEHRYVLYALLVKHYNKLAWKSRYHHDGSHHNEYFIAGICLSNGDITYHIENKYWDLFNCKELDKAPKFDGHNSNDVIDRMIKEIV